ncbi:bifunctional glutamate N-acetyltransferase/amino-acid acetyltransferase ArgJ [Liquorilactobacillus vini]|uniref:Arginine biosynthesis bifunctional protein ArgJ n=1 Tax=Liquorilactobacillus vini DSM 20605 TaxID=1133569 RepID=A0A0R2CD01_9LACO|nr:bifunctional glutamate N-acetyltransferase/amino-acid acetyltransferase ArgJ [Liquorilactobacillus vini]KRM88962.1 bifunctional ornithine acetyltransferase N-acetylglutamate synthase protein [Liquorilactobacillus vini DSM 20605]
MKENIQQIAFRWPIGFKADGIHIGLKPDPQKLDFGWFYSTNPAQAAGMYTTNRFCAAPTALTKQLVSHHHQLQAVVANSAIANSCTGKNGEANVLTERKLIAEKLAIKPDLVGVASTGLIGAQLPMGKISDGIRQLKTAANTKVTEAILTTDTHPKRISLQFKIGEQLCTLSGFAKGSGMIAPNMATMLGFVVTDVALAPNTLQPLLQELTGKTFNQITVDGDTSTNDMILVLANGQAQNLPLTVANPNWQIFKAALHQVLAYLAQQIAGDGEGATKMLEVNVNSATSTDEAQQVAKAIVGSNLVKAAFFGADPNWGRIISTLGMTSAKFDPKNIDLAFNHLLILKHSQPVAFDPKAVSRSLQQARIVIDLNLHAGSATGQAWGCDLTYDYVKINASYST